MTYPAIAERVIGNANPIFGTLCSETSQLTFDYSRAIHRVACSEFVAGYW